ncbi:hypothetical protein GKZ89_02850 [Bacillus mangrovi]|uniref:Uncharacterized protein n=1 Tax=Metabacillus mangrovi TaxID=1491830 RepID=A0A7X2S309_9BACI|nr:hypothetical protein [Metabacillus mangrovi]MTH52330.1 hypothetical protein [Metabacillus mangrovi]
MDGESLFDIIIDQFDSVNVLFDIIVEQFDSIKVLFDNLAKLFGTQLVEGIRNDAASA